MQVGSMGDIPFVVSYGKIRTLVITGVVVPAAG